MLLRQIFEGLSCLCNSLTRGREYSVRKANWNTRLEATDQSKRNYMFGCFAPNYTILWPVSTWRLPLFYTANINFDIIHEGGFLYSESKQGFSGGHFGQKLPLSSLSITPEMWAMYYNPFLDESTGARDCIFARWSLPFMNRKPDL